MPKNHSQCKRAPGNHVVSKFATRGVARATRKGIVPMRPYITRTPTSRQTPKISDKYIGRKMVTLVAAVTPSTTPRRGTSCPSSTDLSICIASRLSLPILRSSTLTAGLSMTPPRRSDRRRAARDSTAPRPPTPRPACRAFTAGRTGCRAACRKSWLAASPYNSTKEEIAVHVSPTDLKRNGIHHRSIDTIIRQRATFSRRPAACIIAIFDLRCEKLLPQS